MFVKEITLKGYIRLSNLNNFNLIKVKFTKKIQAILGTNGSGKSSFIDSVLRFCSRQEQTQPMAGFVAHGVVSHQRCLQGTQRRG